MTALHGITKCKKCEAEIVFRLTASERTIPLDAAPTDATKGAFVIVNGQRCETYAPLLHGDHERHLSHFATCPNADSFRTRKKG